ncbi:hypothetical protein TrRE_jg10271, partial [Triparma retinervis]
MSDHGSEHGETDTKERVLEE